jgi:hypothetical protein
MLVVPPRLKLENSHFTGTEQVVDVSPQIGVSYQGEGKPSPYHIRIILAISGLICGWRVFDALLLGNGELPARITGYWRSGFSGVRSASWSRQFLLPGREGGIPRGFECRTFTVSGSL